MSGQAVNMGLQLFPPPPKKKNPSRKPSTRRHAITPQSPPETAVELSPSPEFPRSGRQTALDGPQSAPGIRETPQNRGHHTPQEGRQTPSIVGRQTPQNGRNSPINAPPQAHVPAADSRSHTSFSETPTLARNNSNSSHTSIAKNEILTSPSREEPVMRSIFPRYNPDLPLEHQQYFPTQTSPSHIPRTIIHRPPYSPSINGSTSTGLHSPTLYGITSPGRFPPVVQDQTVLEPSSTAEVQELWKVTNGWRVSPSEGRKFCLKMSSAAEEPLFTLSSSTQPFYSLRLVPTSTSAQMTMIRFDPSKPFTKASASPRNSPRLGASSKSNAGTEVLSTTLEETARRLPPNDGLVALLYPRAASSMVIDLMAKGHRIDDNAVIAAAERECGRLVWDEDTKRYYLVHPAMNHPFLVSITSSPAWSRVEYTLEHSELPHNLVRLTRDGAGSGFLEVDTAVAARIDCFYVVDVAVCAIMLVAIAEEKNHNVERFEAPPSLPPTSPRPKGKKDLKLEEMEMDLESQDSFKGKKEENEKIPGFLGLVLMLVKCSFWTATVLCKTAAHIIIGLSKCLTRNSK